MENSEYSIRDIREGAVIKGKIVRKSGGDVFIDIGYKSEGIIPAEETAKYTYYDSLEEGGEIDLFVKKTEGPDGMVLLSKIVADKKVIFSRVKKAFKDGEALKGRVVKAVKGGFIIDFGANVTAFLPMSHSRSYGEDITGQELDLKVIQLDEVKRNVVVSYRELINQKAKDEEEKVKRVFTVNEKTALKVVSVQDAGVEVEKEGVRAFIASSELAWKRLGDLKTLFSEGQDIEALVLGIDGGRPVLSVKKLFENPFGGFAKTSKQGDRMKLKVCGILDEGMVVEINPQMDGFIHKSEISYYRRVKDIREAYKEGDEIEAVVVKIDEAKGRVYFSIKRLDKNPWHSIEERYPVGARVIGTVSSVAEGEGAEVELEENFDAFVRVSNVSWNESAPIADTIKTGDRREFRILEIDKSKYRILLGLKQMHASPWVTFAAKFKEGTAVDTKVIDIEDSAVVCCIVDGIIGRIPIRNKHKLSCKKGDVIKARIVKIDKDAKKVILAAKDIEMTEEKKQIDDYIKSHEHGFKLDDIADFGKPANGGKEGGN